MKFWGIPLRDMSAHRAATRDAEAAVNDRLAEEATVLQYTKDLEEQQIREAEESREDQRNKAMLAATVAATLQQESVQNQVQAAEREIVEATVTPDAEQAYEDVYHAEPEEEGLRL